MPTALRVVIALLILGGCTTTANLKATPLKDQSGAQVEADRKRCAEWAEGTAAVLAGFAACLVAGGYETTPEVGSTSQTIRRPRTAPAVEPTRVLLDVLDCDSLARREAERDMGTIPRWIRENLFYWRYNTDQRRQLFADCIRPRGYELGS